MHFDELKEFLRDKYYEANGRNAPMSEGSNLSQMSRLSPVGRLKSRENAGSIAGDAVGRVVNLDVASRDSRSKVTGQGQQAGLPFKLN